MIELTCTRRHFASLIISLAMLVLTTSLAARDVEPQDDLETTSFRLRARRAMAPCQDRSSMIGLRCVVDAP
jgi:hypothetical protein